MKEREKFIRPERESLNFFIQPPELNQSIKEEIQTKVITIGNEKFKIYDEELNQIRKNSNFSKNSNKTNYNPSMIEEEKNDSIKLCEQKNSKTQLKKGILKNLDNESSVDFGKIGFSGRAQEINDNENEIIEPQDLYSKITSFPAKYNEDDKFSFLFKPVPKGKTLICNIIRKNDSNDPNQRKYFLTIFNNNVDICFARKISGKTGKKIYFALNELESASMKMNSFAVMKSNFLGTIYDSFYSENKKLSKSKDNMVNNVTITYETNILNNKPFKLKVYSPKIVQGKPYILKSTNETLHSKFKSGLKDNVKRFINKEPEWSEIKNNYILNFNKRVEIISKKNFQLVSEKNNKKIYLQFGKISKEKFACDFQYPLTPFQAFSICLSVLDKKIACK